MGLLPRLVSISSIIRPFSDEIVVNLRIPQEERGYLCGLSSASRPSCRGHLPSSENRPGFSRRILRLTYNGGLAANYPGSHLCDIHLLSLDGRGGVVEKRWEGSPDYTSSGCASQGLCMIGFLSLKSPPSLLPAVARPTPPARTAPQYTRTALPRLAAPSLVGSD